MATLADSLVEAARLTPHRTVLVDGDVRVDCEALHTQASTLAHALLSRMPTGSVVSFMLPNWHEAAVVYLAATLAGMAVNPILPSLRERELSFILDDVGSRNHLRAQRVSPARIRRCSAVLPPYGIAARGSRGPRRRCGPHRVRIPVGRTIHGPRDARADTDAVR